MGARVIDIVARYRVFRSLLLSIKARMRCLFTYFTVPNRFGRDR